MMSLFIKIRAIHLQWIPLTMCLCFAGVAVPAHCADVFEAEVIGIADGDTLTVLRRDAGQTPERLRVRLAEIDAPEKAQPFGQQSKQALAALCFRQRASLAVKGVDRYQRLIAQVSCQGVDANRLQVQNGMAWVYEAYNNDRTLVSQQVIAREQRRGLWQDSAPVPPWQWRRAKRQGEL